MNRKITCESRLNHMLTTAFHYYRYFVHLVLVETEEEENKLNTSVVVECFNASDLFGCPTVFDGLAFSGNFYEGLS